MRGTPIAPPDNRAGPTLEPATAARKRHGSEPIQLIGKPCLDQGLIGNLPEVGLHLDLSSSPSGRRNEIVCVEGLRLGRRTGSAWLQSTYAFVTRAYGSNQPSRANFGRHCGHTTQCRTTPAHCASIHCSTPVGSDPASASAHSRSSRHGAPGATRIAHSPPTRRACKCLFSGRSRPPAFLMPGNAKLGVAAVRLISRSSHPGNGGRTKKIGASSGDLSQEHSRSADARDSSEKWRGKSGALGLLGRSRSASGSTTRRAASGPATPDRKVTSTTVGRPSSAI